MSRSFRMLGVLAVFVGLCFVVGCSSNRRDTASIEGTLKHNGKPVEQHQVVFLSRSAGASALATVEQEGNFRVHGTVAPGSYIVTVQLPSKSPMDPTPAKESTVPAKYRDEKTTDLKVEVVAGKNHFDLELK